MRAQKFLHRYLICSSDRPRPLWGLLLSRFKKPKEGYSWSKKSEKKFGEPETFFRSKSILSTGVKTDACKGHFWNGCTQGSFWAPMRATRKAILTDVRNGLLGNGCAHGMPVGQIPDVLNLHPGCKATPLTINCARIDSVCCGWHLPHKSNVQMQIFYQDSSAHV